MYKVMKEKLKKSCALMSRILLRYGAQGMVLEIVDGKTERRSSLMPATITPMDGITPTDVLGEANRIK